MIDLSEEKIRLQQEDFLNWLCREIPLSELVTVYLEDAMDNHDRVVYCAL